jgi:hydrogenase nickel incorporation protein HypA/HybF
MHELSIAQNIIEIVHQSVPADELPDVRAVRLRIGTFAGVVPESLEFSFTALVAGTALGNASVEIDHVPFVIQCNTCRQSFSNEYGFVVCPDCGGVDTKVLSGTELQVVEIELEDVEAEAS